MNRNQLNITLLNKKLLDLVEVIKNHFKVEENKDIYTGTIHTPEYSESFLNKIKSKEGDILMNKDQKYLLELINEKNELEKSIKDGGPTSGNHGHGGRPGQVGGSSSPGELTSPEKLSPETNKLTSMKMIYEALKKAGITNPAEHFGIVPSNLLKRLEKRLEQGEENWNSVFKNKSEYEKGVQLLHELESKSATNTEEYKKLNRAINRYDFINTLALEIESKEKIPEKVDEELVKETIEDLSGDEKN